MIIALCVSLILTVIAFVSIASTYEENHQHTYKCYDYYSQDYKHLSCEESKYDSAAEYAIAQLFKGSFYLCLIPVAVTAIFFGLFYLYLHSFELIVTDKRAYGKLWWGLDVSLPIDAVTATAKSRILRRVVVGTSSGKIRFFFVANADEVHRTLSKLIIARQDRMRENYAALKTLAVATSSKAERTPTETTE